MNVHWYKVNGSYWFFIFFHRLWLWIVKKKLLCDDCLHPSSYDVFTSTWGRSPPGWESLHQMLIVGWTSWPVVMSHVCMTESKRIEDGGGVKSLIGFCVDPIHFFVCCSYPYLHARASDKNARLARRLFRVHLWYVPLSGVTRKKFWGGADFSH